MQDMEYFKLNALGRVPTFVGANGFILTETMAIAVYRACILFSSSRNDEPYYLHSYPCLNILLTIYDSDHIVAFYWCWPIFRTAIWF